MKKITTILIALILSVVCALGLVACSEGGWDGKSVFKDWGAVVKASNGGFVAETENYYYLINGVGDSAEDNAFGTPVKGALIAIKKTDVSKTCVVVPKLFVAKDYNSGLFLKGDFVYYATPSTDKAASGSIANTELKFCKTKLDGSSTEELFMVSGLDTQYRIVDVNGVVHVVYYDSQKTSLIDFNASTKDKTTIAVTDVKAESESLDKYTFTENKNSGELTVLYSVTVYSQPYDEEDAKSSSYSRSSHKYNKVYAYKAGEGTSVLVLDGSTDNLNYEVSFVKSGYVFYTEKSALSDSVISSKTYAATVSEIYAKSPATELKNTSYVSDSAIIEDLGTAYIADSSNATKIRQVNLIAGKENEETVAVLSGAANKLLCVIDNDAGNYIYYISEAGALCRKELGIDELEERISESSVSSDWYNPEFVGDFVYYADSSVYGASYVKRVNINSIENIKTDYNENEEPTLTYLTGNEFTAVKTAADEAAIFEQLFSDVTSSGKIVFETREKADEEGEKGSYILVDGLPYSEEMDKAISAYSNLTEKELKLVNEQTKTDYKNYLTAYDLSKKYFALLGFDSSLNVAQKDTYKTAFETADAAFTKIAIAERATIRNILADNMAYYYQEAAEYFAD